MKAFIPVLLVLLPQIPAAQNLTVNVQVTNISCIGKTDGKVKLSIVSGALPVAYQWTNLNNGFNGTGQIFSVNPQATLSNLTAGDYQFTLTDATGKDTVLQTKVAEPAQLQGQIQFVTNFGGYVLRCPDSKDGRALAFVTGGTVAADYKFSWSNGEADILADSLPAGPISVTVTDDRGCMLKLTDTISGPSPIETQIAAVGETCFGESSGQIELQSITGGVPPYSIRFDGNLQASGQTQWLNLPNGQYFIIVEDVNGCSKTDGVVLPSGLEFTFDAGPDTALFSGDTLLLALLTDKPIDTLFWSPAQYVLPAGATEARLFPYFDTEFYITAVDTNGCVAADRIVVTVHRNRQVFVPNVFAPAGKMPENQSFTVFGGGGIHEVALLQVYDRFGKQWFENRRFPVNDPNAGWRGNAGAREADPGVYFWYAVVRYTDGREETLRGDVTLIR